MKRFIYNTQGTGVSHEQIRRLENTQPGSGTYLESDMSGHPLGDEIMLLDGLDGAEDMDGLQGLGFVGAGNYRSRGYDMAGFSVSMEALPRHRRASRDFDPWGLGAAGGSSHPGGRRLGRDFQPYGLGESEAPSYAVDKLNRPDLFIGPDFYPLEDIPTPNVMRAGRDYQPWGLGSSPVEYSNTPPPQSFFQGYGERLESFGESYERWADTPSPGTWFQGLGNVDSDRRTALSVAENIKNLCRSGCDIADMPFDDRRRCKAGCDAVYSAAAAAINAAMPQGGGETTPEQQALVDAKIAQLREAQTTAESGQIPETGDPEMSTGTMVMIGIGVVGIGLLAFVALRK